MRIMSIRLTLLITCLQCSTLLSASTNPEELDRLITLRGDTVIGNAEINLARKWVEIRGEGTYRLVQFKNIYSLQLQNTKGETVTEYRQYDDINRSTKGQFLRQVVKGDVHYLVKSVPRVYDAYAQGLYLRNNNQVVENDYYLWKGGDLMRVMNFKKQMLALCDSEAQRLALQQYVKQYKLRYSQPTDQAAIVKELNKIRSIDESPVASLK